MADTAIDVELFDDVVLPYVAGAEQSLDDALFATWEAMLAVFPGLSLDPLYSSIDAIALADVVDAIRLGGEEPPNPFSSFEIVVDDAIAEALLPLVQALPFVAFAQVRPPMLPTGLVGWGTNPESPTAPQHLRAPVGVDAIHAWHVSGGTGRDVHVADIEDGWNPSHEDLVTQNITRVSTFGASEIDHGTAVMGIILAGDNGVGIVGIAPEARGFLVSQVRASGVSNIADAVVVATFAAQVGGVLLIEVGPEFVSGSGTGGLPSEVDPAVLKAIRLATLFGITVVDGGGNESVDLDAHPFLKNLQPDNPAFVDSRAIVVGGGATTDINVVPARTWQRHSKSTFGKRVDCFASFLGVRAPSTIAGQKYQFFDGTSGASAVIAGVVASIQGMAVAATGQPLGPLDVRVLLRDPKLGTRTEPGFRGGVGSMPDLRKIARHKRWIRVLPVAGAATGPDAMTLVHLDDEDRIVRRLWNPVTFWGDPVPFDPADATFAASPQQVALAVTQETAPLTRIVTDIVPIGQGGTLHLAFADSLGNVGLLSPVKAGAGTVAEGRDIAAVRPTVDTIVVTAIDSLGRLISLFGDASLHVLNGFGSPVVVDALTTFRRAAGSALVSATEGGMNAFAIDDGGNPHFFAGSLIVTIGTVWAPLPTPLSGVVLDPTARPGLVAVPGGLVALAVGTDGLLHSCAVGVLPPTFEAFAPVDTSVTVAATGPVSIVLSGSTLFAIAVSEFGFLQFATRPVGAGQTWSPLIPIDPLEPVSLLGGATAFALGSSVAVLAVLRDGRPCWSRFDSATGWEPLRAA